MLPVEMEKKQDNKKRLRVYYDLAKKNKGDKK